MLAIFLCRHNNDKGHEHIKQTRRPNCLVYHTWWATPAASYKVCIGVYKLYMHVYGYV